MRGAAAEFAAAHARLLTRLLEEAASRGAGGWEPGEAELGLAAGALELLARLPGDADDPGVRAAALALAERFAVPDARSASPAVARAAAALEPEGAPPTDRAAAARLQAAVRAVRAAAAHYVRAVTAAGTATLRIARPPPGGPRCPCLLGLADALGQACEDLAAGLDERARLLAALAAGAGGGFERGSLAAAAADAERAVDALQYAAENWLAALFLHLWRHRAEELGSPQVCGPVWELRVVKSVPRGCK